MMTTYTTGAAVDESWRKYLRYDQAGKPTKDVGNVYLILKNASGFAGCFGLSQGVPTWLQQPTYDVGIGVPSGRLEEHHLVYIRQVLAFYYGLSVSGKLVSEALTALLHEVRKP
jgi:hypothetical protein